MRTPLVRLTKNGAYWLARWTLDGQRQHKSLGNVKHLSKRGAEVLCREIQGQIALGLIKGAPHLSEWCEQYKRIRTDLSPGSAAVLDHTCRYLKAFFAHDPTIDRITRLQTAEWRAALSRGELSSANTIKVAKPLSEATVAKHVRAAKRMFTEAGPDKLRLIPFDPFKQLSGRAPVTDKAWATVTATDLDKIMDACPNVAWKMLFALCRYAGLRRGEALRLQWSDVIWSENKLMVNARVQIGTKKRPRVCPIEPARLPTGLTKLLLEAYGNEIDGIEPRGGLGVPLGTSRAGIQPDASCLSRVKLPARTYGANLAATATEAAALVCDGINRTMIDQTARKILAAAGKVYAKPFHALRKCREMELASVYPLHVFAEWQGHSPEVAARYYLRVDESLYAFPKGHRARSRAKSTKLE